MILGSPFLRQYYIELDYTEKTISIGTNAVNLNLEYKSNVAIAEIFGAAVFVYLVFLSILYVWRNRRYRSLKQEE